MAEDRIAARVEESDQGTIVRSPAVGVLDCVPAAGLFLNALESFVTIRVLGRRHPVFLPRGVQGRVVDPLVEGKSVAVEYGQPLFRLEAGAELAASERAKAAGAQANGRADQIAIRSPSDGIFYRKATPDSPPYVEAGQTVSRGTVLGLVEVMKSFNQVTYGSPDLPERAAIVEVLVENGAEVKFGQQLFTVVAQG